jgi:electron transfer flavoprotein beta subunit
MPSLKGMMRSKSAQVIKWTAQDIDCEPKSIGLDGSPTRVVRIFTPPPRKGGEIIKGETAQVAQELVQLLKDVVI